MRVRQLLCRIVAGARPFQGKLQLSGLQRGLKTERPNRARVEIGAEIVMDTRDTRAIG